MANEKSNFRRWLPVISLTFSTFIFNTSEFIPIGLLSDIASDFAITESKAGMLITVYAWIVALASLPLMLAFSKTENKKLMLSIVALFIVSHVLSGISTSYYMLMLSRAGVACAHAIFWSIVTPLAVRVAPEGRRSTALSLIVTGSSVAMIVGLPLGRAVGLLVGWRATFLLIAALSAVIFIILAASLPNTPSDNDISIKSLPALLKTPGLGGIYLLTVIIITGHYTSYSYIEPFLAQTAGMSNTLITIVLSIFGIVGIIGSYFFAKYFDRHQFTFIRFAVVGISIFTLLLLPAAFNTATVILICVLWGLAINSFNLSFQSEILQVAPHGTAIAMSIYSGIYNVGIGAGALVGGNVCSYMGISNIGFVGGAIGLAASAYCILRLIPILRKAA